MEALIGLLGLMSLVVILVLYDGLAWGFVLYRFWYWFVLPVFPPLPHVKFGESVGLIFFIAQFHNHNPEPDFEGLKKKRNYVGFASPWIVLGVGWIFHNYII